MNTFDRTVPPDLGPPPSLRLPRAEEFTLSNGLRVVMIGRPSVPIVNVSLQVRGGGWEVPNDKGGLASLTADMLDEGTSTLSALEIAESFERLGAGLSSMAGRDASVLRLGVIRKSFEPALALFADVLTDPTFPAAEFARVRTEQLTRILQGRAEPRIVADEALSEALYGAGHPYGRPVLGSRTSVESLTAEDVVSFYRRQYRPHNATLIAAGDIRREEVEDLLEDALGAWTGSAIPEARHPDPADRDRTVIHLVDKPGAAQAEIRVGRLAAPRRTRDYFPLTVLNVVLGGSFTSRLNMKLREERGFTYGARSSFALRRRIGPFVAGAAVHTPVTDLAVRDFLSELSRIADEHVPVDELERAKRYVALRLPQGFETTADLSARISELVLHDLPLDYYDGYVEAVLGVTASQVQAVARQYLTGGLSIVVVGEQATVEEPLRALGVGDVVIVDRIATTDPEA